MVAIEAHLKLVKLPWPLMRALAIPAWLAVAILCKNYLPPLEPLAWGLVFMTLLNATIGWGRLAGTSRVLATFAWVGRYSYSLYLIHLPVRSVAKRLLPSLAGTENPLVYVTGVAVISAICLLGARVFYRFFEEPFLQSQVDRPATLPLTGS
jgi:peptidoglycan/LPS O-acetylase OafA/YrhL